MKHHGSSGALVALLVMAAALPAQAQSSPSADQIIQELLPHNTLVVPGGTRGIRASTSPAPNATGSAAPAAPSATPGREAMAPTRPAPGAGPRTGAPPVADASPSVNLTVQFPTGSAELTPRATQMLDELGRALSSSQLASFRFRIEGHTDTVGTPDANRALSARRAAAVVDYLATRHNVSRTRLEAVGMGEDGLLVATPAQTAEPRNRRVQVVNISA